MRPHHPVRRADDTIHFPHLSSTTAFVNQVLADSTAGVDRSVSRV
jgi:hypothetical protein